MNDRHVLITGGGTGIGAAIAQTMANQGARLTLVGRKLPPLQAVASKLPQAQAIVCDVTDPASVESAFTQAAASFGAIEILVNNAGAAPTAPFHKLTAKEWREVMAVNLDGVFNCTSAALDNMLAQRLGTHSQYCQHRRPARLRLRQRIQRSQTRRTGPHPLTGPGNRQKRHHRQRCLPGLYRHRHYSQLSSADNGKDGAQRGGCIVHLHRTATPRAD